VIAYSFVCRWRVRDTQYLVFGKVRTVPPSFSAVDLGADNGFDELGWNSVAELPDRGRYYPVTFQPIPTRAEAGNSEEPSMATGYRFGGGVERGVPAMAFAAGDALRLSASR